jgi:hypothetical protein
VSPYRFDCRYLIWPAHQVLAVAQPHTQGTSVRSTSYLAPAWQLHTPESYSACHGTTLTLVTKTNSSIPAPFTPWFVRNGGVLSLQSVFYFLVLFAVLNHILTFPLWCRVSRNHMLELYPTHIRGRPHLGQCSTGGRPLTAPSTTNTRGNP